jgi:methyltransferase-like protein
MSIMYCGHFPPDVTATLERIAGDLIQMEQYMDFIRNRMFRQTLLCRKEVSLDRELRPSDLVPLHIASALAPENPETNLQSADVIRFRDQASERIVSAKAPLLKATLLCLAEVWPESIPYPELISRARRRVDRRSVVTAEQLQAENNELGTDLLRFYVNNLIELRSRPPCFTVDPGLRPLASRTSRIQAQQGYVVTTLRHGCYRLNDFQRCVLPYLDGQHDRGAIHERLWKLVKDNVLVIQRDPTTNGEDHDRRRLGEAMELVIQQLGRAPLLLSTPATKKTSEPAADSVTTNVSWDRVWNS